MSDEERPPHPGGLFFLQMAHPPGRGRIGMRRTAGPCILPGMNRSPSSAARMLGLSLAALLGAAMALLGDPAMARERREPRVVDSPYLERARFEGIRKGMTSLCPDLGGDTPTWSRSGRQDVVAFSGADAGQVREALKAAYHSRAVIGGAFTVEGWAHLAASDSHTFTLYDTRGARAVVEVFAEPTGTRVVFWGLSGGMVPARRPISELPVRLVPGAR